MTPEKLDALLDEIPDDWETLSIIMNYVGHKYWQAAVKERGPGAVQYLESEDNSVVVFTRGEYREELKQFVLNSLGPSQEKDVTQEVQERIKRKFK